MREPSRSEVAKPDAVALAEISAEDARHRREQTNWLAVERDKIAARRTIETLEKSNQRLGLVIGGIVALAGMLIAYKLIEQGYAYAGGGIAGFDLVALVGMFAYGHVAEKRRLQEAERWAAMGASRGNDAALAQLPTSAPALPSSSPRADAQPEAGADRRVSLVPQAVGEDGPLAPSCPTGQSPGDHRSAKPS